MEQCLYDPLSGYLISCFVERYDNQSNLWLDLLSVMDDSFCLQAVQLLTEFYVPQDGRRGSGDEEGELVMAPLVKGVFEEEELGASNDHFHLEGIFQVLTYLLENRVAIGGDETQFDTSSTKTHSDQLNLNNKICFLLLKVVDCAPHSSLLTLLPPGLVSRLAVLLQ